MSRAIVVEGTTIEACKAEAGRRLGLPVERLSTQVLCQGKQGFFTSQPWRVRVEEQAPAPPAGERRSREEPGGGFLSKLDIHVKVALSSMEQVDVLQAGAEGQAFNEILASYDQLSEDRRKELTELSKLMSGPMAKKVQERVSRDGYFTVRIAADRLSAHLDITPPEGVGRPVTLQAVLQRLREEGVVQGVDHVQLRRLLEESAGLASPVKNFQVAQGTLPQQGTDGRVEYLVEATSKQALMRDDGSVDHRGKARITMVKAGQPLARLVPPTPGMPGVEVCGAALPTTPGKTASLKAGENVVFDAETGEYRTAIDGLLEISDDALRVRQTFLVSGDVDMTTGNIEFNGVVQVLGSVRDGFSVRATRDIEIHGRVEACEVTSAEGCVKVMQGVAGRGRCFISAGTDVEARYIENARVYARRNVVVEVAIMHSEVVAGESVSAMRGKGAIIGGVIKAGQLVSARSLGAPNEPVTDLLVGISIEQQDQIRAIDQRLASLHNAAHSLEEVVKAFEHAARDIQKLPGREKDRYVDMRKKLLVLHYETDRLEAQRREFVGKVSAEARGMVRATGEVFGKVIVRIGNLVDRLEESLGGTTFRADPATGHIVRGQR